MRRASRLSQARLNPKPVERIELDESNPRRKLILVGLLLVLGGGMLAYGLVQLLNPSGGWQTVEAESSGEVHCGGEFTFLYEVDAASERKALSECYTLACQQAYRLFHSDEEFEGVTNVCTLNRRPNEVLTVEAGLYEALKAFSDSGRRELYLGPVYTRYDDIFFCEHDGQLTDFDPRLSEAVAREYGEVAAFARAPQAIDLELLGEGRVRLRVSEAYLAYAQENGIDRFIDFSWMRNAFIADYLAQTLTDRGYTKGTLSSYDGFTRDLDGRETDYSRSILDLEGGTIYPAASMRYRGPCALVTLRDYPLQEGDRWRFYQLQNGEIRTMYLDISDGLCRSALHSLTCYAEEKSCGQVLLEMLPVYIADTFQPEKLEEMASGGTWSVYCKDRTVYYTDPAIVLDQLYADEQTRYTAARQGT